MYDLDKLRNEIDEIDRQMQALFERRMKISEKVAAFKIGTGKPVFDPVREEALLQKLRGRASDEKEAEAVAELYRTVLKISRDRQTSLIEKSSPTGR